MSNFEEVCTVPTDFGVSFTKLKSKKTGLTVMLADIEGKREACLKNMRTIFTPILYP
jgi:hypothetical protein